MNSSIDFNQKTVKMNQRGFSLIEMLVSIGLTSILLTAGFLSINVVAKSINRETLSKILIETKANLVDSALHPTALAYTISDPANTSMECLRNQTDCAGNPGGLFKLRNKRNGLVYDPLLTTAGFGMNGDLCNEFNGTVSNPTCPFRYELTWSPICPSDGSPCDRPTIRISGQFRGPIGSTNISSLNEERLSFSILTASGTTDLPYVKKEMVYLDRGTSVTIDVLKNSWAGTTNGTLKLTAVSAPSYGTASVNAAGHLVYTPTPTYYGLDSAVITVLSDHGETSTSVVWFKVMTPYTWTGNAGDSRWTTAGNWCGLVKADHSGCVGNSMAPSSTNYAIFDGTCAGTCEARIDPGSNASVTRIKGIHMKHDFLGSLTTVTGVLRVDEDGFRQAGGIFTSLDGSSMVHYGHFEITGGSFTAPSSLLTAYRDVTIAGAPLFNANNGTFRVATGDITQRFNTPNVRFHSFDFANGNDGGWIDFQGSTVEIAGDLHFHPWLNHYCPHFENGTINATGSNIRIEGCGAVGNGVLVLKGNPAGQTITAGATGALITNLKIDAGTHPVKFVGIIEIAALNYYTSSYNYVSSGPVDVTGSTLKFTGPMLATIVPGTVEYNDVIISTVGDAGDVDLSGQTMKVRGKLTLSQNEYHWCIGARNGTFEALGDVEVSSCGLLGEAVVKIAGNPAGQTIRGLGGRIGQLRIEAGANPVRFEGEIKIQGGDTPGSFTYVNAGTLNWSTSKLMFIGSNRISITPGTAEYSDVVFSPNGDAGYFNLNGSTMNVKNKLTMNVQQYHHCGEVNNGTLAVTGTVENSNVAGCGNGSVVITTVTPPIAAF